MKSMLISLAVVLSFVVYAMTEARESPWKGMIAISGREAQAIAIAVREFEKHHGTKTAKSEPVYGESATLQGGASPNGRHLGGWLCPEVWT